MLATIRLFLGGADLEMATIAALARRVLGAERVHDEKLAWGAGASAYAARIAQSLAAGERPVLVELSDDLAADVPRERLVFVDHHGDAAGAGKPSSLRQVFDLLGRPESEWTRREMLVEANDVGHIRGLRAAGASAQEIRAIRDADRAAQGVTAEDEAEARRALEQSRVDGALRIVTLQGERTAPVADFVEPEYGGPGAGDLLLFTPSAAHFFGDGRIVRALSARPGCWFGGALPDRGFWGATISIDERAALISLARG